MSRWAEFPEPWCWIGPQFRAECQRIMRGEATVAGDLPSGLELRRRRKALGLTQQQLAAEIGGGAAHPVVSLAESGGSGRERVAAALLRLERERDR